MVINHVSIHWEPILQVVALWLSRKSRRGLHRSGPREALCDNMRELTAGGLSFTKKGIHN